MKETIKKILAKVKAAAEKVAAFVKANWKTILAVSATYISTIACVAAKAYQDGHDWGYFMGCDQMYYYINGELIPEKPFTIQEFAASDAGAAWAKACVESGDAKEQTTI